MHKTVSCYQDLHAVNQWLYTCDKLTEVLQLILNNTPYAYWQYREFPLLTFFFRSVTCTQGPDNCVVN